jgi:hypothetical protein
MLKKDLIHFKLEVKIEHTEFSPKTVNVFERGIAAWFFNISPVAAIL